MTREQMRVIIKAALDRNIVVFDSNDTGFTLRLVSLMKVVFRRNAQDRELQTKLDTIYIGEDTFQRMFDNDDDYTPEKPMVVQGVNILPLEGLNQDGHLSNYYVQDLGGHLPSERGRLAVGVLANAVPGHPLRHETLLGAY